jgi:hypothetical protein
MEYIPTFYLGSLRNLLPNQFLGLDLAYILQKVLLKLMVEKYGV